jgi:hypothetical protein
MSGGVDISAWNAAANLGGWTFEGEGAGLRIYPPAFEPLTLGVAI